MNEAGKLTASAIQSAWERVKEEHGIIDFEDIRASVLALGGPAALRNFDDDIKRRENDVMAVQGRLGKPRLSSGAVVNSAPDSPASFFASRSFSELFLDQNEPR